MRRPQPVNKLAEEGATAHLNEVVMHCLTGAVVAHRLSLEAEVEAEKGKQEALLMAYVGTVANAVSLRGFDIALHKAIVVEKIRDPRKLHRMAAAYQPAEAA